MRATTSDTNGAAWRLILGNHGSGLDAAAGARNMAVDHALLESAQRGSAPVLRLYRWAPACLSFGRNQLARGIYDPERARAAQIDVTRRPTGGLAVLHDCELTYSVAAPLHLFGGPRAAYVAINRALVEGLRSLGVPAALAATGPRRTPVTAAAEPCFQAPAPGEVVVLGRKLIGSAQRAEAGALLQHGAILLDGSQAAVMGLLAGAAAAPAPAAFTTMRDVLGRTPAWDELTDAFVTGFEVVCGTRLAPDSLSRDESRRAAALEDHYRAASWTWRR